MELNPSVPALMIKPVTMASAKGLKLAAPAGCKGCNTRSPMPNDVESPSMNDKIPNTTFLLAVPIILSKTGSSISRNY